MRALPLLAVGVLSACALDDRPVEVNGACLRAPANGVVADFSEARERGCPAGYCTRDLVYQPAVELDGKVGGLVFPYASPGVPPVLLGLVPENDGAAPNPRMWAGVQSGPSEVDAVTGFALRTADCIDASGYKTLSFTTDITNGDLGDCELLVAATFVSGDAIEYSEVIPLDRAELAAVPVQAGTTAVPLSARSDRTGFAGLQWEFAVSGGDPAGCAAYFAIDDLTLLR
jgi:hypothetical protein